MSATQTRIEPRTAQPGESERFAHIVHDQANAANRVFASFVEGTPVEALCGKVFVPSRDATRYPVCPECKAIKEQLQSRGGGGGPAPQS